MSFVVLCLGEPNGLELCDKDANVIKSNGVANSGGKKAFKIGELLKGQDVPGNLIISNRGYRKAVAKVPNPLPVKYYSQIDSTTGQGYRMCFSSSCAMLLNFLKPGILTGENGDDQYLNRVNLYGDSTESNAQIQALHSYGLESARFSTDLDFQDIDKQLSVGRPVPIGIEYGESGHWILVIGKTLTGYIVHDPYGELYLPSGSYDNSVSGANLEYSKAGLAKRWKPNNAGGWGVIA